MKSFIDGLIYRFTDHPTREQFDSVLGLACSQSQRAALLQEKVYVLEHKLKKVNQALYPDVEV